MKLALINPANGKSYGGSPPLNLALIASYVRQKHEVVIIDMQSGDSYNKLLSFKPDWVGLTATTLTINKAYEIAESLRGKFKVIIGGIHASVMPDEAIKHADIVVIGEGEKIIVDILDGKHSKGILNGEPIDDIDTIPLPAYDLLNMDFYLSNDIPKILKVPQETRTGNILTSRGCPFNCTFCHNSFRGLKFRMNSPEKVIEEIKLLKEKYRIDNLFFIEDNFFANLERVKKICELMIENDLVMPWGANSRVDNLDKEVLELAKKSGCVQITFGWESGSQRMLDIYNKRTKVEQNVESIKICNEVGISPNGTVMVGGPTETIEDLRMTKDFILNNDILGGIGVCITTAFPGTQLWVDYKIGEIDYDKFSFAEVPIKLCDIDTNELIDISNRLKNISYLRQNQMLIKKELERLDF